MKLAKLNQKEISWIKKLAYDKKDFEEEIIFNRKLKTFLRELRKIEKKNGYTPIPKEVTIFNMISYFGWNHFEYIEEFVSYYETDMDKSAKHYFEYFY